MANRIKGITIEIDGDITGLDKSLKGVNTNIRNTSKALKDVERLLKIDPKNTELLEQKQKLLAQAVDQTKDKLKQLKDAEVQAKEALEKGDLGQDKYDALQREIAETENKLKKLQKEYKEFGSVAKQQLKAIGEKMKEFGGKLQDAGGKIQEFGKSLTTKVTVPIAGIGTAAVKLAADFDEQMSKVKAISGANANEFEKLRDKAREMGEKTKFSATEAAEAFEYMAMAGWKTEDMLDGIEGVMNLAAASGEELGTTSDIVTDALTAFGMTAKDSSHFADVLAAASTNANTNVGMMGETFKYVAPVAGALGFKVEDVAAGIGLMANAGIKSSQAGTALRSIMQRLAKPTEESYAAMQRLGISLTDNDGKMKSFRQIMDELRSSFGQINMPVEEFNAKVSELDKQLEDGTITQSAYDKSLEELTKQAYGAEGAEKARAAAMLAGTNGMSGLLAIVNASEKDYQKLTTAINDCNGKSKEMADTMNDNLAGQVKILISQLQELAISLADQFMPAIREAVKWIQGLVQKFSEMDDETKTMIVKAALVVAAMGPVLTVLGSIITVVGGVSTAIGGLLPLLGGVAGATGGATAAAGAASAGLPILGAAFIFISTNVMNAMNIINMFKDIINSLPGVWEDVKNAAGTFASGVKEKWSELKQSTKDAVDDAARRWESWKKDTGEKISSAVATAKSKWDSMKQNARTTAANIAQDMGSKWASIKEKTGSVFGSIRDKIGDMMGGAREKVRNAIEKIKGFFDFKWSLPKIKLPHFSITGSFSLNPPSIPHFSVDWYAKAMEQGMILNNATIFGEKDGKLLGGGEAGSETIVGTKSLLDMIRDAVASAMMAMRSVTGRTGIEAAAMQPSAVSVSYGDVNMTIYGAPGQDVRELANIVSDRLRSAYDREAKTWA